MSKLEARLRELDCETERVDLDVLLQEMLSQIGSTDPVLRDELIYQTFCNLVLEDHLSEEQLVNTLTTCLDEDHLFLKIGQEKGDAVFTRSFSVLIVALILHKDRESSLLSRERVENATEAILRYLQEESDIRGFVKGKGWAHSIAHGADALDEAIRHEAFPVERIDSCLNTIAGCLFKKGLYVDDEDERLLMAIEALLSRGLKDDVLATWVDRLEDELSSSFDQEGFSVAFLHTKGNVLGFLKSCYFRLKFNHDAEETMAAIEDVLEKWTKKFYS
ncbi:DUF2785 domain-containing protein [Guptibacillus algicola]|uniref:DUF2785 domain-containing protein n=1 Tax=Guptibacillus algicola TaxID=225844 RepID=UPI001CD49776|nr:DUF2785 domain-containing protein [Alkalihalobacillus algicola]MCA0987344.1 DUF2785 domain-containing protein [Alkalihalobacillus algicola]